MKDLFEQIQNLIALRDSGAISEDEFKEMMKILKQESNKNILLTHQENSTARHHHYQPDLADKKKRFINWEILKGIILVVVCFSLLFFLGYLFKIPSSLWDKDKDGVYNWSDSCPDIAGNHIAKGCPDTDNDGVADQNDQCMYEPGGIPGGCPDSDNDGVLDKDDKCVHEYGLAIDQGCPVIKRDTIKKDSKSYVKKRSKESKDKLRSPIDRSPRPKHILD